MATKIVFNALSGRFDLVQALSSYVVGPTSSTDNEIPRYDGTTGKLIQTSGILIDDSFKIYPSASNSNLIIDGNGTGVVQHNTGSSSYQMPKSRASSGTPGPMLLRCLPASGNCEWYDISALLVPYWQLIYDYSSSYSTQTFTVDDTYKGLRILDASTPITGVMFAVRNNAETTDYLYVDSTTLYTDNYVEMGDYGTESAGINIGGTTYSLSLRVNDLGGGRQGQIMMHRHSTSYGSLMIGSRSNSDTSAHADLANSQTIIGMMGCGWAGTNYKQFGIVQIESDTTGTISDTSSPGRIAFYTTADSSTSPTLRAYIDSAGTFGFGTGTISSAGVGSAFTQWNVDNLRLDGNTISSTNSNGNLVLDPNGTGVIQLSANTEMSTNTLSFGSSNQSAIFFDTGLVINPKVSGSGVLTIGSATGTASGDMIVNKIGVGNTAISSTSYIVGTVTGAGRGILAFTLNFTGAGTSATVTQSTLNDQGSAASFTASAYLSQTKLLTTSHTTYTQYGMLTQNGIDSTIAISSGTYSFYGSRIQPSANGTGGSHTGGTFRRYGLYIDAITALSGSPGSDLIMGAYIADSINIPSGTKLYFDSTTTALGDSYIYYDGTNTDVEVYVDGTNAFRFDADKNISKLDFKLDVVGTGHYVKEGTNATMGSATLVGGTVTVNTTKVTANSRIYLTNNANGGTVGAVYVSARTAGTSFTITSTSGTDTSTVAWLIVEPA